MKQRTFFGRYAIPILILVGGLAPFIVYSAGRTVRSNSNRVQDWLPKSFVETGDLAYFRQHFLGDQFVLISWDGCKLGGDPADPNSEPDDPRIEKLVQALVPDPRHRRTRTAAAPSKVHYFKAVTTGRHLMNQLTNPPMELPYAEALKRLQGLVIGPDGRQTCVVASLTDEASTHFRELIGRGDTRLLKSRHKPGLLFNILEECGVTKDSVHLGGPPVDNVAIDEEGERTLIRLALLSGLFGLFLAWWSLKSVKLTLIVFGCGLLSGALGSGGRVVDRPDGRCGVDVDALDGVRAGDFRRCAPDQLLSRGSGRTRGGGSARTGTQARVVADLSLLGDDGLWSVVVVCQRSDADSQVRCLFGVGDHAGPGRACSCTCRRRCKIWPIKRREPTADGHRASGEEGGEQIDQARGIPWHVGRVLAAIRALGHPA